jgi:hypothetical protein
MSLVTGERHSHAEHHMVAAGAEPYKLPGAGEINRQIGYGQIFD